ncbi:hypothetical protein C3L33_13422, partial [Rhododendron williamsianum]
MIAEPSLSVYQLISCQTSKCGLRTGGSSNRQKEHKKAMPLAAKRAKVSRSREVKKKKQQHAGKQFRGRKAWK